MDYATRDFRVSLILWTLVWLGFVGAFLVCAAYLNAPPAATVVRDVVNCHVPCAAALMGLPGAA